MRVLIHIIAFALCALTADVWAASVAVRQTGGQSEFTAELGQIIDLEVFASGKEKPILLDNKSCCLSVDGV